MKTRILSVLACACALAFSGCATDPSTGKSTFKLPTLFTTTPSTVTPSTRVADVAKLLPTDVALALAPVLAKNPSYKQLVLTVGQQLPGVLVTEGQVSPSAVSDGIAKISGITAQQQQDLSVAGVALTAALQLYQSISGKSLLAYTDPNVVILINAFSNGLIEAGGGQPIAFPVPATPAA